MLFVLMTSHTQDNHVILDERENSDNVASYKIAPAILLGQEFFPAVTEGVMIDVQQPGCLAFIPPGHL